MGEVEIDPSGPRPKYPGVDHKSQHSKHQVFKSCRLKTSEAIM